LFNGRLIESVQIEPSDRRLEGEASAPAALHTVAPEGEEPFANITLASRATRKLLPEYGKEVLPGALQGFDLATDAPAGSSATQLWAVAGPHAVPPAGSKPASLTLLHGVLTPRPGGGGEETWSQLNPTVSGAGSLGGALVNGGLAGSRTTVGKISEDGVSGAIAPEPGSERAWLSSQGNGGGGASVALVEASTCGEAHEPCAKLIEEDRLPLAGEAVGERGSSGPIACPAPHDCWLASSSGWLFHLSGREAEAPDTDPLFDGEDGVISSRPLDEGVPAVSAEVFGEDDSLANQQVISAPPAQQPPPAATVKPRRPRPLVKRLRSRFHGRTLTLSFILTARAHVQLIARRGRAIVAKTRRETLRPGRRSVSLSFDRRRWPTSLQFKAKPLGGGGGGGGGAQISRFERLGG
ncbi:MAG: hypothetical protein FWD42_11260, partial [Solirubrobacterales bacterium]|nr:hypothetical protein [Solirubrobacterales bacterium]